MILRPFVYTRHELQTMQMRAHKQKLWAFLAEHIHKSVIDAAKDGNDHYVWMLKDSIPFEHSELVEGLRDLFPNVTILLKQDTGRNHDWYILLDWKLPL